ncbi:MAG TPA: S-adenosylmethionine:tRNA ribosyltransferase-isomerase [Ilumatobacteraceae bacterium]|jgi:S-adenosylmethionine:tRNA ribosyltransferase-isomerase
MSAAVVHSGVSRPNATGRLSFDLPRHLEAAEPAEARGMTRDAVRLLVAERSSGRLTHTTFGALPTFLEPGDLVVINTSAVVPAAVAGVADDGTSLMLHFSTRLDDGSWAVEPRRIDGRSTRRWDGVVPRHVAVGANASVTLDRPYLDSTRLWVARLALPQPVFTWLAVHGQPIRYGYVDRPWPISAYQNVYATEPGSAEMPSAGRPFTPEVITRLVAKGIGVSPLVLHTGVASLESTELPYPERLRIPPSTANRVNDTHRNGGRVIAVGTTVVRGLETAADADGIVRPIDGWTDLVVTPERGVHAIDGLLTGWHEPEASHLLMLEAVGGRDLLEASYAASLREGYLWHEFGDMHLIIP